MSRKSQDEFGFDDTPEQELNDGSVEEPSPPAPKRRFALAPKKGGGDKEPGSSRRILLLVLLGVAVGALAFFYLAPPEGPAPRPQPAPVRRPVPPPPKPAKVAKQAPQQAEAAKAVKPVKPVKPAPQQAKPAVATQKPKPGEEMKKQAAKVQPTPKKLPATEPAPKATAKVQTPPQENPAPAKKVATVKKKAAPPAPKQTSVPSPGEYRVQIGAYGNTAYLEEAEREIAKLGLVTMREAVHVEKPITRLIIGQFPIMEARAKLADLKKRVPDAFLLPVGDDKLALCAGSYLKSAAVPVEVQRLKALGIEVQQKQAVVPLTLQRLSIGPLKGQAEADSALKKVKKAGFDGRIISLTTK